MPRSFTNDDYSVSQFLNNILLRDTEKNLTRDNLFSLNFFIQPVTQNITIPAQTTLKETEWQPGGSGIFIAVSSQPHTITPGPGVTVNGSSSPVAFSATPFENTITLTRINGDEWLASISTSTGGGGGGVSLDVRNIWTKAQDVAQVDLTDAATISVDASASNNFTVELNGNRTLGNPTNLVAGQVLNIEVVQGAGGNHTLAFDTLYLFPGGISPIASLAAGAIDFMSCYYDGTSLLCSYSKGYA